MPKPPIPETFHDILESTTLGHLATINERGYPEVNPVWFLWDGERVLISVREETRKFRNLERNPHLAMSFLDAGNSAHYLEVRGQVVSTELFLTLEFVNQLAAKYTGAEFTGGQAGQRRYKLTIQVDSWTGQ